MIHSAGRSRAVVRTHGLCRHELLTMVLYPTQLRPRPRAREAGGRPRASTQVYFRECRSLTGAVAMISCGGEQRSSSNIDDRPDALRGAFQTKEYR